MSIFSKIAAGEIPSYKCAESDKFYAFLDINPLVKGHTLVIPRKEVDYIFDLDDELFVTLHRFSRSVAKGLKKVCPCIKVGEAVVGIDVPHVHIHLMPLNKPGDLNFGHHVEMSSEELKALAAKIAAAIEA